MPAPNRGYNSNDKKVVGSSKGRRGSVKKAIRDAYTLVPAAHPRPVHLRVVTIWAIGENPLSEYRVELDIVP